MTPTDRLRIERAVWTLDTYLTDLPRRSRIAHRREVRANLRAAADDVGTSEALHRLGALRRLAAGYLAAEYGEWQLRPAWKTGAACMLLAIVLLTELVAVAQSAFGDGIRAADPHAAGTFHWHGFSYLTQDTRYTFVDGRYTTDGGAWTPLAYVGLLAVLILSGRLWRALPAWRRGNTDG
jgi:hypothetical protein